MTLLNNHGVRAIAAIISLDAVAITAVLARTITRTLVSHNFGADDTMLLLSLVFALGYDASFVGQVSNGLGRHIKDVDPKHVKQLFKFFFASVQLYGISLAFTKVAFLLQYLRFIAHRRVRILCYVMIVISILWCIASNIWNATNCIPVKKFWEPAIKAHCGSRSLVWFTSSIFNFTSDLVIFIIPIPTLLTLRLPRAQKIAILGIFMLGGAVCIVTALRFWSLIKAWKSTDPTYDNLATATWSHAEISTGILCASLPGLKPLFGRWIKGLGTSNSKPPKLMPIGPYDERGSGTHHSENSANVSSEERLHNTHVDSPQMSRLGGPGSPLSTTMEWEEKDRGRQKSEFGNAITLMAADGTLVPGPRSYIL